MNLLAVLGHGAPEQVDRHFARLYRCLVGLGAKLQQVGKIALKLRDFRADSGYQRLPVRASALQAADCRNDRREARFEILTDRRKQYRTDSIAFSNARKILRLRFQPRALERQCNLIDKAVEQLKPVGGNRLRTVVTGKPKRCAMSAGLDDTFDAAIYVGYHAKAGTHKGVLCHTFHSKLFDVSVNGVSYGEGGINALYASLTHGVPVILTSGDRAYLEEIRTLIPALEGVETKVGLTYTAAQCHPLKKVLEDYAAKTRQLLENRANWKQNLLTLPGPYELKMTFINPLAADAANTIPGVERVDGTTLLFKTNDFQIVYQMLQACYSILAYTNYLE